MTPRPLRLGLSCLTASALVLTPVLLAQDTRSRQPSGASSSRSSASSPSRSTAKGELPDPVLLDGSNQPPEKRPEQGMIGEFELPGDENARTQQVGGPQGPQGQQQEQEQQGQGGQQGMAGTQGGQQSSEQQQGAGGQQQQQQPPGSGNAADGPQDPNAKAEGVQVAQLETDPNAESQAGGAGGQKPPPVEIGDKAMQIKSVASPAVVGSQQQQASTAQQMEKQVGGGKGSAPIKAGTNAAERGRAMPAGL